LDWSEGGLSLELERGLETGLRVGVKGQLLTGVGARPIETEGLVRWSVPRGNGAHLIGIAIDSSAPGPGSGGSADQDYYEVLQVSPHADPETITRVFRALAQRFHPDNPTTGDENWFKVLVRAYEVLNDPQKRAAYDLQRPAEQQARWRIFDTAEAARGVAAERRKRHGILSLLYVRRANDPINPALSVHDFEQLLGCPREHLDFALWFLKENAWVVRSDNGRYAITAKGVEKAEAAGEFPLIPEDRMIEPPSGR
jgi:hypothetical protein